MSIIQAIILGIVQGLTEFIPISSTAHLIFASRATGLHQSLGDQQTTAVIAVIQLGTLIAVLIYFAQDIWNITLAFIRDHLALLRGRRSEAASEMTMTGAGVPKLSQEAWLGWLVIIGSVPIATVGLLLKKVIEGPLTKNLWLIATMMIVVAVLLLLAEKIGKQRRGMNELGVKDALAVGGAQVLALLPGASRSGSTIMAGLFAGEKREAAARFSFLLSIPAIAASGLLELKQEVPHLPEGSLLPLAVATIVSGIVGYASIFFLLRFLRTHSTGVFIGYRLVVGFLIIGLLLGGVLQAQGTASEAAPAAQPSAPATPASLLENTKGANNNLKDSVNLSRPSSQQRKKSDSNPKRR
ncbi:MAG TPA: undecaprenyl-diphosphate phosphatase [Pyrinomonadaceae bacterium]|jgi:undecaprenyl-diphosphatase